MDDTQQNLAYGKVWPDLPGIFVNLTWDWDSQVEVFNITENNFEINRLII